MRKGVGLPTDSLDEQHLPGWLDTNIVTAEVQRRSYQSSVEITVTYKGQFCFLKDTKNYFPAFNIYSLST